MYATDNLFQIKTQSKHIMLEMSTLSMFSFTKTSNVYIHVQVTPYRF